MAYESAHKFCVDFLACKPEDVSDKENMKKFWEENKEKTRERTIPIFIDDPDKERYEEPIVEAGETQNIPDPMTFKSFGEDILPNVPDSSVEELSTRKLPKEPEPAPEHKEEVGETEEKKMSYLRLLEEEKKKLPEDKAAKDCFLLAKKSKCFKVCRALVIALSVIIILSGIYIACNHSFSSKLGSH